ncbi:MAG TPA: hypothetical protein VJ454_15500, partial [Steroidobacteraceae bacterium]|nr:hypothetical protein [Steroidobacteraceae bacterium]
MDKLETSPTLRDQSLRALRLLDVRCFDAESACRTLYKPEFWDSRRGDDEQHLSRSFGKPIRASQVGTLKACGDREILIGRRGKVRDHTSKLEQRQRIAAGR